VKDERARRDIAVLAARMEERDRAQEQRFLAQEAAQTLALTAQEKAVLKAEAATERRFEGVNEFRQTLADQQQTFIGRSEADARFTSMEEKLSIVIGQVSNADGRRTGADSLRTLIFGLLGAAGVLVAIFFALRG
jgi:hypothetical protein